MAERRVVRRRQEDDEPEQQDERYDDADAEPDSGERPRRSRRRRGEGLTAAKAAQLGLRQIPELTGKKPEGVTGVEPTEDGWLVGVEIVEDRRVPSSTDILAIYEIEFDAEGELISYRRVRRYSRGRGDSEDS